MERRSNTFNNAFLEIKIHQICTTFSVIRVSEFYQEALIISNLEKSICV